MDKLDQLLAEAKPLYLKRKQNRKNVFRSLLSTFCVICFLVIGYRAQNFVDNDDLASYYVALYEPLNDDYFNLDINQNTYYLFDESGKAI